MTWRRLAPWVIAVVALVAIFIDLPRGTLGLDWLPSQVAGVEFKTVLGLDLKGGIRVTLVAEPESDEPIQPADMETARSIIERRVAGIGVNEPQVRTETGADGSQRIVVEVPGVDNPEQVRRLVGSTGQLEFIDPMGQALTDQQDISALIEAGTVGVLFDGGEIDVSSVAPAADGNVIGVEFSLSEQASDIWCDFTSANVDRPGPIALDGELITVPTINQPICQGQTIITVGPQTEANEVERTELYNTLRFGALPIALAEQSVETVAPTLGADFLAQALVAGAVGLTLVLIFMIAYYRLPGVLAAIALIFYTLVVYAVFRVDPRDADAGGRRRLHPLDRHGGRREHPHLRAHEGGDPRGQDPRPGDRSRLQPGVVEHPRLERREPSRCRLAVLAGDDGRPRIRARPHRRRARQHVQRRDGRPARCCDA